MTSENVHAQEREQAAVAKRGPLSYRASTSAVAAQITLTNLDDSAVRFACVKGSVERKGSSKTTEPHIIVGAVEDLCSTTKQTYFGERKELDWDLCTFDVTVVDTPSAAIKKATL